MKEQRPWTTILIMALVLLVPAIPGASADRNGVARDMSPLTLGVASITLPTQEECGQLPNATVTDETETGVRTITVSSEEPQFTAQLEIRDNIQKFTSAGITAVLSTRPGQSFRLDATDSVSKQVASIKIQGDRDEHGTSEIRILVDKRVVASFGREEAPRELVPQLTKIRLALSKTILPVALVALNLFNAYAPENQSTLAISVLGAVGGLRIVLPPVEVEQGLAQLPTLPHAGSPSPEPRPRPGVLGRWQECLRTNCAECGECFTEANYISCNACPGTSVLDHFLFATCYNLTSAACVPSSIVGVIFGLN